jgi:hypothetical protein
MTTTNLTVLKAQKEAKVSQLITDCSMFFAFSNEQFHANKTPLQEGEKYVSLGAGAYMPKGKVDAYLDGIKAINKWYKSAVKDNKLRKENIIYELNNQEAFYTYDIESTLDALGSDYTEQEVKSVFNAERDNQIVKY